MFKLSAMVIMIWSPDFEAATGTSSKSLLATALFVPRPVVLSPFEQRRNIVFSIPIKSSYTGGRRVVLPHGRDCSSSTCHSQLNVCARASCTNQGTVIRRLPFAAMLDDEMSGDDVDETNDDMYEEEGEEMKEDSQEGAFNEDEQEEDDDDAYIIEDADDTCYDNEPEGPSYVNEQEFEDNLLRINGNLSSSLGITLEYASISVQDLFLPFKQDSAKNETISLSNFYPLYVQSNEGEDELFFPKMEKMLVRPSMKRLMKRFTWNQTKMRERAPDAMRWVLIGSPGTGKSLLFFLAAVWKASKEKQPIVYLRKGRKEQISIFYMFPNGPNKVGVYFKRISNKDVEDNHVLTTLMQIFRPLNSAIKTHLHSKPRPLWFVDGPKYDDKGNALDDLCDYSCSSGGYPRLKNEEQGKVLIWVLDRWSKKEIISALCLIYGQQKTKAQEIYHVTGGCMRDAAKCVTDGGMDEVKADLKDAMEAIKKDEMVLVSRGTENPSLSSNRVRMSFVDDKKSKQMSDIGNLLHKVDSYHVIKLMQFCGSLMELRTLFMEAQGTYGDVNIAAAFYEAYWHKWFETTTPLDGMTFYRDVTGAKPLEEENQYWVPEQRFLNIDAALVQNNALYVFQYATGASMKKKKDTRKFDMYSFMSEFVAPLRKKLDVVKNVSVAFVTNTKDLKERQLNFANKPKKGPGGRARPIQQTSEVTCYGDLKYCMVDGVKINFYVNDVYADVRSDRIPNFFPCFDDSFGR
jgi:hypothetical protein